MSAAVSSSSRTLRTVTSIERWSLLNAVAMIVATAFAVYLGATWPAVVVGGIALVALAIVARGRWTPAGTFGRANLVTAARLALLLALPLLPADGSPLWPIVGGLVVLVTDGLDGWLARRYGLTSEFGEFFDKETDALFLLVICLMTASRGHLPDAVIALGLLRYLFVVALFVIQPNTGKEYRSSWARVIYVIAVLALLAAFLPYPALTLPLVAAAAAALFYSFGRYAWWLWRERV
jgi:phosphatidylglycerophosphate synthase